MNVLEPSRGRKIGCNILQFGLIARTFTSIALLETKNGKLHVSYSHGKRQQHIQCRLLRPNNSNYKADIPYTAGVANFNCSLSLSKRIETHWGRYYLQWNSTHVNTLHVNNWLSKVNVAILLHINVSLGLTLQSITSAHLESHSRTMKTS